MALPTTALAGTDAGRSNATGSAKCTLDITEVFKQEDYEC